MTYQHHRHPFSFAGQRSDYYRLKHVAAVAGWPAAVAAADAVIDHASAAEADWRDELIDAAASCAALVAVAYGLITIFYQ